MYVDGMMDSQTSATQLNKALEAGYGTDAATFIDGHALLKESCEATVVGVLAQNQSDWKLMAQMKKTPMLQPVHQIIRRTGEGDYKYTATSETGEVHETNQELERLIVNARPIATLRGVSMMMKESMGYENAEAAEKLAGIDTILKSCEYYCFHGNKEINDKEFDGLVPLLTKSAKAGKTASIDLRGDKLSAAGRGETTLNEIAQAVYERGGYVDKAFFPPVIAGQFYDIFKERQVYLQGTTTDAAIPGLNCFSTSIGSVIRYKGDDVGADKFFQMRGEVKEAGNASKRPGKPTVATLTASDVATNAGSLFTSNDEAKYTYAVHALNEYGMSEASTSVVTTATVKSGEAVTLTITKGSGATPTGYVITRNAKGGTKLMEIAQIPATQTTFVDLNETLPGTADMILLPKNNGLQNYYDFGQLMPISTIPMYPTNSLMIPFIVGTFATLILRAPEYCGILRNIGV